MVDIVRNKALYFDGDKGEIVVEKDVPEDLIETCNQKKLELIAALAEHDPTIEEYYLNEDINVPVDIIKKSIRQLTIE
jgi:elongation factor G